MSLTIESSAPLSADGVSFNDDPGLMTSDPSSSQLPDFSIFSPAGAMRQLASSNTPLPGPPTHARNRSGSITPTHAIITPPISDRTMTATSIAANGGTTTRRGHQRHASFTTAVTATLQDDGSVNGEGDGDSTSSHQLDGAVVLGSGATGTDGKEMTSAAVALRAKQALSAPQTIDWRDALGLPFFDCLAEMQHRDEAKRKLQVIERDRKKKCALLNECHSELEAIWTQWSRYIPDSSIFLNKDWEIKTNSPTYRERIFGNFFDRRVRERVQAGEAEAARRRPVPVKVADSKTDAKKDDKKKKKDDDKNDWVAPIRDEYDSVWNTILGHYERRDVTKKDLPPGFFDDFNILAIGKPLKTGRKLPDIAIALDKRLREDIAAAKSYEWTDELFDKLSLNDKINPSHLGFMLCGYSARTLVTTQTDRGYTPSHLWKFLKAQASSDSVEEIDRGVWHQFWRTLILLIENEEDKFRKTKLDPIVQLMEHQRNWYALRMANIFGSLTEDPSKSSVHRAHVKLRANVSDSIHWRYLKPLELIIGSIPEEVKVEGFNRATWDQCWQSYMSIEGAERLYNFINVLKIMTETTLRRYKEMRKNKRLKDGGINGKASVSSPSAAIGKLPILSTASPSPSPQIFARRLSNASHSNLKQPSPRVLSTSLISPTHMNGNGNGAVAGNDMLYRSAPIDERYGKSALPSSSSLSPIQSHSMLPQSGTDMYYDQIQTATTSKPPAHKKSKKSSGRRTGKRSGRRGSITDADIESIDSSIGANGAPVATTAAGGSGSQQPPSNNRACREQCNSCVIL